MTDHYDTEKLAIDIVVSSFFSTFNNKEGQSVDLECLADIFLPGGVVVRTCGEPPSVHNLAEFIAPRHRLLNNGELEEFSEEELWERTDIFGSVAQRLSLYMKSGILSGKRFRTRGMKSIQLVNTKSGWKISAVAWDDERDGVSVPDAPDQTSAIYQAGKQS